MQSHYASGIEWVTLELKVPHMVDRTPKAMEQVFAGLHSMKSSINFKEKWWDGRHQKHISMEIVGRSGSTHFFVRTPTAYRKLIESQLYAQYKDAEILEAEDYTEILPPDIPNDQYDMWGTELIFTKEDAYPIRTYRFFEEPVTEKKFIDPLSSLVEVLGELQPGEEIWVQYLIRPTGDDKWQRDGQRLINKLIGKKESKGGHSTSAVEDVFQFFVDLIMAIFVNPQAAVTAVTKEDRTPETLMQHLPPGMRDVVAALEESISKHGFETVIRMLYIAKWEVFSRGDIAAMLGAFKQFSTYNLNGFKPNNRITPKIDYLFKKTREASRKRKLYQWARERSFADIRARKQMVMNTEELATVYHVPATVLEVPTLPKVMAKKAEPPATLPTV